MPRENSTPPCLPATECSASSAVTTAARRRWEATGKKRGDSNVGEQQPTCKLGVSSGGSDGSAGGLLLALGREALNL